MDKQKDVDGYIASAPKEVQIKLKQLRGIIQDAAPNANESISYGMPYYFYSGRLVYFGLFKNHIGLFIPPPIIEQYKMELKDFNKTKSSLHLSLNNDLPVSLIKKLIKARIKWNKRR